MYLYISDRALNPMDRGAWRATVHGVSESDRTEQLILSLSPTAQQVKEAPCNARAGVRTLGREHPWRRKWQPLQYSCLKNPMDRGA